MKKLKAWAIINSDGKLNQWNFEPFSVYPTRKEARCNRGWSSQKIIPIEIKPLIK